MNAPLSEQQLAEIESDRAILKAAPRDSADWDDTVWAAWWRTAERAHANDPLPAGIRELIKSALSNAGAYCGECGFEPGDRIKCRDCERCWDSYADALAPLFDGTPEGLAAALAESGRKTAEIERMRAEYERESMELIEERDNREEWADRLADAVGPIELIGEHSSGNNPWANALELITPHAEVKRLKAEVARQAREIERLTAQIERRDEHAGQLAECLVARTEELIAAESRPSLPKDAPTVLLAKRLLDQQKDVVAAEPVNAMTLDVRVEPETLGEWDWWLGKFHIPTGETTTRGSCVTAEGHFGSVRVLLTGLSVGDLYAAERDRNGGAS